jgi:hypothetical protein
MDIVPSALFIAANILACRLFAFSKPNSEENSSGTISVDSLDDVEIKYNTSFLVDLDNTDKDFNQHHPIVGSLGLTRAESTNSIRSDYSLGLSRSVSIANNINELGNLCIGIKFNTFVDILIYTGYTTIGVLSIGGLYYLQHKGSTK